MALSGCFTYVPVGNQPVPAGQEIRITLSRQAMAALPEEVAAPGTVLQGVYTGQEGGELRIRVPVWSRDRLVGPELRQEARIPLNEVQELAIRRLDTPRTLLVTAGSVAAATGLVLAIMQSSGNVIRSPGEGPEQFRFPLARFPLP